MRREGKNENIGVSNVNKKRNTKANKDGAFSSNELPQRVANQLNILIPVGIAIIIVAAVKYALVSMSSPTVYIWSGLRLGHYCLNPPLKPSVHLSTHWARANDDDYFAKASNVKIF